MGIESTPASRSDRPTVLLYRRTAGGYELAGAMFTAPIASGSIDTKAACDAAGGFFMDVAKQF